MAQQLSEPLEIVRARLFRVVVTGLGCANHFVPGLEMKADRWSIVVFNDEASVSKAFLFDELFAVVEEGACEALFPERWQDVDTPNFWIDGKMTMARVTWPVPSYELYADNTTVYDNTTVG